MKDILRLNSLDKKPKLYNILIISAVTAVIAAVLIITDPQKNGIAVSVITDIYFAIVTALLIRAFFLQMRYNLYSYNTVFYFGFAVFLLFVLAVNIMLTANMISHPDLYDVRALIYFSSDLSVLYHFIAFPFTALFCTLLVVSNIALIIHEGARPVNFLGIIFSALFIGALLLFYRVNYYFSGSQTEVMIFNVVMNTVSVLLLYIECMLLGAITASAIAARYNPKYDKDFIIILGCGILPGGEPTPLLRGRIDRALDFYNRQKKETGKELYFVTSGGQGKNEIISECESMKRYLISKGVDERLIIEENRSTDTFENMRFSKELIDKKIPGGKVAFSTTNFHVFRSGIWARRVGLRALGMGAKTKWYFWPNAWVREFIGLLSAHRGKQFIVICALIIIFVTLTILSYI